MNPLAKRSPATGGLPAAAAADAAAETYPVSFAQQRMWLLDRLLPAGGAYNTRHVVRLVGTLDVAALQRALAALVARHETLRTRFALVDGLPVQAIAPDVAVSLVAEDVDAAHALARAREESVAPFDLARDLPWRVRLWRLGPGEHWLQFTLHHIATDGWSTGVLVREMSQLYAAFRAGQANPLPPLPIQYADYAAWQREWLQGDALARQVDYWRGALAQVPVLALPTDRPRSPLASHPAGQVGFVLPRERVQALQALGRREGATLFMTLLAAFHVLLARYSGQDDIAVGVPTAGRTRPELEGLIGFFVNTLVLRADLAANPSFRDLLVQVRDRALEAFAHQDVPFEKLVEELAPQRDLGRNPLFQASMVLQNAPAADWQLPGVQATPVDDVHGERAKFELTLILHQRDGALLGTLEYAQDLFDASTVEGMAAHWQVLLDGILDDPGCPVAHLPLLSPAQRDAVLALGRGARVTPPTKTVHALFAEQVQRSPEAIAVVHDARSLGYRDLDRLSCRVAHQLRALGVGPGVPVALCLPRSIDLVAGMLGILRAGGAYVPLAPDYPAPRLAFIIADTQAPAIVTTREHASRFAGHAVQVVCVDDEALAALPDAPPEDLAQPHDLACVVYTSGSTGQPKGVMVAHANVVVLARDGDYIRLAPHDVVALAANVAFDATTFEVWATLLHGACIAVVDADDLVSAAALRRTVHARGITAMFLTTALFGEIAATDPSAFRDLTWLLFGGEAHDPNRVREVMEAGPPRHLVHVYGPTETTTFATFQPVGDEHVGRRIPIGRAIAGTEVLVLDARGQCVPPGVVGEVHIGGCGVARGYLGRDDETHRRFVPHPLRPEGPERVFRSGDLARWTTGGALDYVGRNDAMVKIRGFRIEPAETAAVLGEHPGVHAAHVAVRASPSGEPTLVAYFIARAGGPPPGAAELRRFVAARLPPFMLPSCWMAVKAFPLNANGKLDATRLPAPPATGRDEATPYVAPRDDLERALCRIWSGVLGVPQVGLDDDFFALGGHSLLAARAFGRMDESLDVALPLATLFACPTVRTLAQRCRSAQAASPGTTIVALTPGASSPPLFLVPGVGGHAINFVDIAQALGRGQALYGLQSPGLEDDADDLPSIEALARHHLQQVRTVQPAGPYAFGGTCFGATVAYEMARQAMAQGEAVACLFLLNPTQREGRERPREHRFLPRPVRRTASRVRFILDRLALYRQEFVALDGDARAGYVASKLAHLTRRIASPGAKDVERELRARETYRSNVVALDRYHRKALVGDLRKVVVIQTAPRAASSDRIRQWLPGFTAELATHVVSGHYSGDMLSGRPAREVAAVVAQHLAVAFATAPPSSPPVARAAS